MVLLTELSNLLKDICLGFTGLGKKKEFRSKKHVKYPKGTKLKKIKILQKLLSIWEKCYSTSKHILILKKLVIPKCLSLSGLLLFYVMSQSDFLCVCNFLHLRMHGNWHKLNGKKKKAKPNLSPDIFVIRILLISFPTWCTQMNKQSFVNTVTTCILELKNVSVGCICAF